MRRLIISIFLVLLSFTGISALDITLNGRNLTVIDEEILGSFARAINGSDEASALPLNALFPWLESLEYVEAQSGPNRIYWEAERISLQSWNDAMLIRRGGVWEIHLGRDVFSAPDRIVVHGVPLDIDNLCIWSVADLPDLRSRLETSLTFRKVTLDWRRMDEPSALLEAPPASGLPHLVIHEVVSTPALSGLLTSGQLIDPTSSCWYTTCSSDGNSKVPSPLALDAYSPEAALLYVLSIDTGLFTGNSNRSGEILSPALADWLNMAADARSNGTFLVTRTPLAALESGDAAAALMLPSSVEEKPALPADGSGMISMEAPAGLKNLSIPRIAAIPLNLTQKKVREARLLMAEFPGAPIEVSALLSGSDERLRLFYQAYERIGRLAISGQMNTDDAIALMNEYISVDE